MKAGFLTIWLVLAAAFVAEAANESSENYAAVVNGVKITEEDVNRGMLTIEKGLMKQGRFPNTAMVPDLRGMVLDKLIEQELLFQESRKNGIRVEDAVVEEHLGRIRESFRDEKSFSKSMKESKITEAVLREQIRRGLAVQRLLEKQLDGKINVTDSQIRNFYEEHTEDFREPQRFGLYHILMYAGAGMDSARKSLIRKSMQDALERLRKGEDFGKVAGEVSQSASASKGGDLGYVERESLPREVGEALMKLKPGETSPVVQTNMGFHIVRLYGTKPERIIPFEEVKGAIRDRLSDELGREEKNSYVDRLKAGADIRKHQ